MAKVDIIQTSFNAGEFAPSLFGRTDILQYANACAIVQNMLPRSYGPAISMPGTRYVATVSDSTLRTRLIPFVFNRTDAYAIEMGDLYMRFFTNHGQVSTYTSTEDLSAYGSNLKAQYKCNDNTNSTTVLDGTGSHSGSASTLTTSLSTTGIINQAFNLFGNYHISVPDHADFTRTASSQPMSIGGWVYYKNNGGTQTIISKSGEYELSANSADELSFFAYSGTSGVKLLLHCDGVDASTSFVDSSGNPKAVTANGNAQVDTAQTKFGTGSLLCDGTGDYLSIADSADFNFSTGDFTVEYFVRYNAVTYHWDFDFGYASGAAVTIYLDNVDNSINYRVGATDYDTGFVPITGAFYHIALTRSSGVVRLFVDGVQKGTDQTITTACDNTSTTKVIGTYSADPTNIYSLNGWIDEVRVINGTAAFTSNFTPPSIAYAGAATNSWKSQISLTQGWHFLFIVFKGDGTNSTDCKIYIDTELTTISFISDASFTKMSDTSSLFRIGANSAAGGNNFANKVDNIAFIHQELTAVNIMSLYTTTAYQLTTVFTANEVFDIQYTQLNDVIWLTHPNHPPQKLIRTSANEWTISTAPIIGGPFLDENTPTVTPGSTSASTLTITASATTGTVNITVTPTNASLFTISGSTLGHLGAYWMIGGLAQTNVTTGLQEIGYVRITNVVNSYTATATVIKNLAVSTATTRWAEGAFSAVRGYPSKVVFHDRRLFYARTNYEPQKEWGSVVFEYDNFALGTEAADDGLNLPLASNESNEIQWLASGRSLIAGTFGGGFITKSGTADAITPSNVSASEEIGFGSSSIMPKKIGNFLYFVQNFGKRLREMFYNFDTDSYKAVDRTILSPHILGDGVVDMDVQHNPEGILYCVLTSGTLATMTREADQEVTAWAEHTTNGTYTSIAIIPSQVNAYDEAWVIVERWINGAKKKYVEYFENIEVPSRQDKCLYLHSALTYDAYDSTSLSATTISLSASSGSVTLTSSTAYFVGANVGKKIRAINSSGTTVGEGQITATTSTTSITLSITTIFNSLNYSPGFWGMSVQTIVGLDHLTTKTVGILADGLTESLTRTVVSNAVTLGASYFVISIGLSYDQIIYTLPKEAGSQKGTSQGKLQRYNEISFKVNRSTQDFKYGPDASHLDDVNLSFTPSVTTLYTGILPPQGGAIAMRGGYTRGAQIYIKNSNPLPIELLSIQGSLDTEDK